MSDPRGEPIETGTRSSSIWQCGCGELMALDCALTSVTPGVHMTAVVVATMPCTACGKVSRGVVNIDEDWTEAA
jgi:hypothetical protein